MPTAERLGPLYSQPAPIGLQRLMAHLLRRFPGTTNGGMYNPSSSLSGGGPSPHRVTQALDLMCNAATAPHVIRYLQSIANALNLQQAICWHEIITAQRWSSGIRFYAASDHSDGNGHSHTQVGLNASRNFDPSWVGGSSVVIGPQQPPMPKPAPIIDPTFLPLLEDDAMDLIASVLWQNPDTAAIKGDGNVHLFWIEGNPETGGELGHRWDSKTGWAKESITDKAKTGMFMFPQRPHVWIAPSGQLVVSALGHDGTMNSFVPDGHGGWGQQVADV